MQMEKNQVNSIIQSQATWYEKGEKSNKYFLNLETHKKALFAKSLTVKVC